MTTAFFSADLKREVVATIVGAGAAQYLKLEPTTRPELQLPYLHKVQVDAETFFRKSVGRGMAFFHRTEADLQRCDSTWACMSATPEVDTPPLPNLLSELAKVGVSVRKKGKGYEWVQDPSTAVSSYGY